MKPAPENQSFDTGIPPPPPLKIPPNPGTARSIVRATRANHPRRFALGRALPTVDSGNFRGYACRRMQLLQVRIVSAGPLSDLVFDLTRGDGRARPCTCVFGGPGTGKTT